MNQPDPLANLHDIIEPVQPGFWPPAPGYIILFLAIVVALAVIYFFLQKQPKPQHRKHALRLINETFSREYASQRQQLIEISKTLRRIVRIKYPSSQALHGAAWQTFLNKTGSTNAFTTQDLSLLTEIHYQPEKDLPRIDDRYIKQVLTDWVRRNL